MINRKIILLCGRLAAGKSTFARELSRAVNLPYFIKDTFKIALCESVPITNREEGSRFSAVTFDGMMYATERLMEVGFPLIIEGNFAPSGMKKVDEAGVIQGLVDKYKYRSLTYHFTGDARVLYKRYIERNELPERGDANRDFEEVTFATFDDYNRNMDKFHIPGQNITVDTTELQTVDFASLIDTARLFLQDGGGEVQI